MTNQARARKGTQAPRGDSFRGKLAGGQGRRNKQRGSNPEAGNGKTLGVTRQQKREVVSRRTHHRGLTRRQLSGPTQRGARSSAQWSLVHFSRNFIARLSESMVELSGNMAQHSRELKVQLNRMLARISGVLAHLSGTLAHHSEHGPKSAEQRTGSSKPGTGRNRRTIGSPQRNIGPDQRRTSSSRRNTGPSQQKKTSSQ